LISLPKEIGQLGSLEEMYVDRLTYTITYSHSYKGGCITIN